MFSDDIHITHYWSHTAFKAVELLAGEAGAKADADAARTMRAAADFMVEDELSMVCEVVVGGAAMELKPRSGVMSFVKDAKPCTHHTSCTLTSLLVVPKGDI